MSPLCKGPPGSLWNHSSTPPRCNALCFVTGCRNLFHVDIDENKLVSHLKDEIKTRIPQQLATFEAFDLKLHQVVIEKLHSLTTRATLLTELSKTLEECNGLDEADRLSTVLVVDPPEGQITVILVQTPEGELPNDSPLLNVPSDYRPRVTLNVLSQRNWNAIDLLRNDVDSTNRPPPDYIKRFKQKLIGKRVVKDEGAVQLLGCLAPHLMTTIYFDVKSHTDIDVSNDTLASGISQEVIPREILHYFQIFSQRKIEQFIHNKEPYVHYLLYNLDDHVHRISEVALKGCLKFNGQWNFHLIVDIRGDKRQYTPKSDAFLSINSLPHLLLEVVSDEDHEWDRFRMLLQAACLARLRRALRQESADPFIVSAIYIDSNLRAAWYLLYQPDWSNTAVRYVVDEFDLKDPMATFQFVFRLYNLVELANEVNATLNHPLASVMQLRSDVVNMKLPALTAFSRKRKTRDGDDGGNGSSKKSRNAGEPAGGDILSNVAVMGAMEHAGYTVPSEDEELNPLVPVRVSFP